MPLVSNFTAQKVKCSIQDFFSKCDQIYNGKLHFLCSASMRDMESISRVYSFINSKRIFQALDDYFYFAVANLFNFLKFALAVTIKIAFSR